MTDGLKDVHREAIVAVLAANDRVERAVLFGSRATGTNTASSDVDIALFGDRLTLTDQARLAAALDEIPMAQSVDLLLYNAIRERTLRDHIRGQGIEWYTQPTRDERFDNSSNSSCPANWTLTTLGRVCTKIGSGATPRGGKDVYLPSGPYALIRSQNVLNEGFRHLGLTYIGEQHASQLAGVEVLDRDVLLNITGDSVARACQVDPGVLPARVNQHVAIIRPDPQKLDPGFLRYSLVCPDTQTKLLSWAGAGGTRNALTKGMLEAFDLLVPDDAAEQRAIAHVLGTLDERIALNRRMNATIDATARALFRSWFVDFDPVRAKMKGRDTGLPNYISRLFPDRLVTSHRADVPKGWHVGTLAEHFDAVRGVSYKGSGLRGEGTPLHNLNSVREGGGYKYEGIKFYAGDYADRHVARPGDVIVANTEQGHERLLIGFAAIVPGIFGDHGICSQHVYRLRPRRTGRLSPAFLQLLLNSPRMHDLVSGYANGTTVNMLPIDAVQRPLVLVPPSKLIEAFDGLALDLEHRREHTVREACCLGVMRGLLLPKLVSGELRIEVPEPATTHDERPAPDRAHEA